MWRQSSAGSAALQPAVAKPVGHAVAGFSDPFAFSFAIPLG